MVEAHCGGVGLVLGGSKLFPIDVVIVIIIIIILSSCRMEFPAALQMVSATPGLILALP